MCIWFNCQGNSTGDSVGVQHLIGTYPGSNPETTLRYDDVNKRISFTTRNSTTTTAPTSPTYSVNFSQWAFACAIVDRDSGNQSIYLNGVRTNNNYYVVGDIQANQNITMGRSGSNGATTAGYVYGYLDEARVYNRSLSQAEITAIYNSGRIANSSLPSTGLVAWFPFNEYNGNVTYNLANTNLNGVIYGS
jgi:hypothetical protein